MTSRPCPYCDGAGCSECDGTGERHTTFIDAGDGMTGIVHGNAPLSPESRDALIAVTRAAHAQLASKPECRLSTDETATRSPDADDGASRFAQLAVRLSHAVDDARAVSTPLTAEQRSQITAYLTQITSALRLPDTEAPR